ncbi:hypothetical protein MTO96_047641 [Rhipicephalus appendiculatus]
MPWPCALRGSASLAVDVISPGQYETTKSLAIGNHADVSCYRIVSARSVGKRSPTVLLVSCDMTERTKSAVWKHFEKNSAQEATCKSRDMKLRTPSTGSKDDQTDHSERTAITTRISQLLALDLQPYSCAENRGFKELMNHMEPFYKIPSRTTSSRTTIPKLYRDTVTAVKERMHADFQEGVESSLVYE